MSKEKEQLDRSWIANASAWRDAVREHKISSRRIATDAAIIDGVISLAPRRVLDLGCGEGWLSRELASRGVDVTGIDSSQPLIDAAKQLGGATFHTASYEELATFTGEAFDVAVANFAVLEEDMQPLLRAASRLLTDAGTLIIQTVHPAFSEPPYTSGWRTETFEAIDGDWREPMPYFFRTIAAWSRDFASGGFAIHEIREPADPNTLRPLSLIFFCRRG